MDHRDQHRRNLSGVFIRVKDPETDQWESRCFEELDEKTQRQWLGELTSPQLRSMIVQLGQRIGHLANTYETLIRSPDAVQADKH